MRHTSVIQATSRREPWWKWHWDRRIVPVMDMHVKIGVRWRRGSLLTVYRLDYDTQDSRWTEWWFYGPFNFAIGFSKHPTTCGIHDDN